MARMENLDRTVASPDLADDQVAASAAAPDVAALITQAAAAAAAAGLNHETFIAAAWAAFMEAKPGLRAHLERVQLEAHFEHLRSIGKMGQA